MRYPESREESPKLKVFSLNTCQTGREYGLFDNILDFIYHQAPEVVLLQEVYEGSLEMISNALGGRMVFSRYCNLSLTDRAEEAEGWGVAIGSKRRLFGVKKHYYDRTPISPERIVLNNGSEHAHSLLLASLKIGSERFNFGTTHLTWHNQAKPSDEQLEDFEKLAVLLDGTPDLVLTGDFNSPRGYPIFDRLAGMYLDNIPKDVRTTMDTTVRSEATWEYVIDGFFTSPHYLAKKVEMVQGLSDHQGILAEVQKAAVS